MKEHLLKIAKFGGTSMADAIAMNRCAQIVVQDKERQLIVVSAVAGVTNLLMNLCKPLDDSTRQALLEQIRLKHSRIIEKLTFPQSTTQKVDFLLQELGNLLSNDITAINGLRDKILAYGELLSSIIFVQVLREAGIYALWFDVRTVMHTDSAFGNAEPDIDKIYQKAMRHLAPLIEMNCVVTQGFIGANQMGDTTTLGRGGGDYSAALLAEALRADVLEIWTDVSAIYTTDPRVIPDAQPIHEISFDEAAELAVFGAKVLHPATLRPAMRQQIKVFIGSSIDPGQQGTWIVQKPLYQPTIRAVSIRKSQTLVTIHCLDMLHRHGFLAKIFQILANDRISIDLVTTSEVNVALTLDTNANSPGRPLLSDHTIDQLNEFSEVKIEEGLALVALVGNELHHTSGVSATVFNALTPFNIRLVCHGASPHNVCFLVNESEVEEVVRILHKQFIEKEKENKLEHLN